MQTSILHHILITDEQEAENLLPESAIKTKALFEDTCDYKFWDKDLIEKFIKENFKPDVFKAYQCLTPYAYKSDLARYCLMYVYGGWYVDVGITMVKIPELHSTEMLVFRDLNNGDVPPWQVANGLIYARPKNLIFLKAIMMIIENCKKQYYGHRTLSQTGPDLFGRAIAIAGWDHFKLNFTTGDFVFPDGAEDRKKFVLNNETIALYKAYKGGDVGVAGTNNYNLIFGNREVYKPWI